MADTHSTKRNQIPPDLEAKMTPVLKAFVLQLLARIEKLEDQVQKLAPRNSSLPPSSEHPHAQPIRRPKKNKRKQGGQKGHQRHVRPLIPTEDCAGVIPCIPAQCRRCGDALSGHDPQPIRHQVWDVPPIQPIVTEYQRHRLHCPGCGLR